MSRLTSDVPARERALLALSRLQDSHGYDLWWLAGKDAVEVRRWYAVFPVLAAGTLVLAVLYLNLLFLLDANGVCFGAGQLRTHAAALVRVTAAIGEVDQGALITGSNMSGKSTFVRAIGVTTVMAQTLNTCLAAKYEAPILRVRSSIGRSDDLLSGTSYYLAEVEALLDLVNASADTSSHLFLLDELFRGTNAVDRIAAAHAVLTELVSGANWRKPHLVIAATHDVELVDLLTDIYPAYHFGDAVVADGLAFDHRLQPGRATTRNAIALLRLHGAPEALINRALTCAAELDRQRGTTVVARS